MPEIPKKQMAMVIEKTGGPVEYKEIDVVEPGPDEVLINIKYSGVCHTDLHAVNGDWPLPTKLPLVGGHEGAGVVVKKGNLCNDIEMWVICAQRAFQRADSNAVVTTQVSSGSTALACSATSANSPMNHSAPRHCSLATPSTAPSSSTALPRQLMWRAYTRTSHWMRLHQCYAVSHASQAVFNGLTILTQSAAGITVYKGLKESGAKPGQTVAIVGAGGGLGSLAQQYAKAMGLRTIAIDSGEDKRKMCTEQLGSYAFVDFATSKNVVKDVQEATEDGLGPHAVILVAVNEKPFQQAAEVRLGRHDSRRENILTAA